MLDFNGHDDVGSPAGGNAERDELRSALLARLEGVLFALFPAGKVVHGKFVVGDDPIFRNACAQAIPFRDSNGNIKVNKSKRTHIIDPLVAAIMAVHAWGGETATSWEFLRDADI